MGTGAAVIGAGNVGIAVACYLAVRHGVARIVLVEPGDPMALTSAQSGENHRNWWPHPAMRAFTDDAIGPMEEVGLSGAGEACDERPNHLPRKGLATCLSR